MEDLYCQAEELWEEVSRLRSIREEEIEIDRIFSETQQLEKPPPPAAVEKLAMSTPGGPCSLWRMERMGAGDFWHKEEGSYFT